MADTEMVEGLTRLPDDFQKTNKGIERLIEIFGRSDEKSKKEVQQLSEKYRKDIGDLIKNHNEAQAKISEHMFKLKESGASNKEILEYTKESRNAIKSNEKELSELMKAMKKSLVDVAGSAEFQTKEDREVVEIQTKTLERYLKEQKKSKNESALGNKAKDVKERASSSAKAGLLKGAAGALTTALGPLRLITDPLLKLAGSDTSSMFDSAFDKLFESNERNNERNNEKDEEIIERYTDLFDEERNDEDRVKPESVQVIP